jgi:NADPH:quinone reductase-like Zn-dependent oxidoreductase
MMRPVSGAVPGPTRGERPACLPLRGAERRWRHARDLLSCQPSAAVASATTAAAEVTGVSSAAKAEHVRALGAQHVLDYTHADWTDGTHLYDVILDVAGNTPVARMRRALTGHGTVVFVGGEHGGSLTGMGRQLRGALLSPFIGHRLVVLLARERAADYEHLARLIEAGRLVPALDRRYPLERAAEAVQELGDGTIRGKVALTV